MSEKFPLTGICRVTGVSGQWLQSYVNEKYKDIETKITPLVKKKFLWQFHLMKCAHLPEIKRINTGYGPVLMLKQKKLPGYISADEAGKTRENSGNPFRLHIVNALLFIVIYLNPYIGVLPSKRHRPQAKRTGKTNHIERFNNTMRQRVSRLVRKTLSFSKKFDNHTGAIMLFVHHYNNMIIK